MPRSTQPPRRSPADSLAFTARSLQRTHSLGSPRRRASTPHAIRCEASAVGCTVGLENDAFVHGRHGEYAVLPLFTWRPTQHFFLVTMHVLCYENVAVMKLSGVNAKVRNVLRIVESGFKEVIAEPDVLERRQKANGAGWGRALLGLANYAEFLAYDEEVA